MTLLEVTQWLEKLLDCSGIISAGNIDGNAEKYVGVYNAKQGIGTRRCIGDKAITIYEEKAVSILVHWTNSPAKAEEKAIEIANKINGVLNIELDNGRKIAYARAESIFSLGRDEKGICEYNVEAKIVYII